MAGRKPKPTSVADTAAPAPAKAAPAPEAPPRRVGRPLDLTSDLTRRIAALMRGGIPVETAALTCGVNRSTLWRWLARGRDLADAIEKGEAQEPEPDTDDWRYVELWEDTSRARAEAESAAIAHVRRAWEADPRNAQWFLERAYPQRWGRRDALAVEGNPERPVTVQHGHEHRIASSADLAEVVGLVLGASGYGGDVVDAVVVDQGGGGGRDQAASRPALPAGAERQVHPAQPDAEADRFPPAPA